MFSIGQKFYAIQVGSTNIREWDIKNILQVSDTETLLHFGHLKDKTVMFGISTNKIVVDPKLLYVYKVNNIFQVKSFNRNEGHNRGFYIFSSRKLAEEAVVNFFIPLKLAIKNDEIDGLREKHFKAIMESEAILEELRIAKENLNKL